MTALSLPLALLHWRTPTLAELPALVVVGALGTVSWLCVTRAFALVEPALAWTQNPNYSDAKLGQGYMAGYAYCDFVGPRGLMGGLMDREVGPELVEGDLAVRAVVGVANSSHQRADVLVLRLEPSADVGHGVVHRDHRAWIGCGSREAG